MSDCKIDGCERRRVARAMCDAHYSMTLRAAQQTFRTWRYYDVDEVAVERFVVGDVPARFGLWERREAVRILTLQGRSARDIAGLVGVSARQVVRDRGRVGVAS